MAIIHDVKVTMKIVITETELLDQDDTSKPPKKESGQKKYVIENNSDYPAVIVPADEIEQRLSDMMNCFYYGTRASTIDYPPTVETDSASSIAATTATLNGRVTGEGCTAGFQFGTTRELTTGGGTVVATGSPTGAQATIKQCTYAAAGLVTKTKYYFRFFAQYTATGNTQYGIIRSFTTL
jgi:hypothetical protein